MAAARVARKHPQGAAGRRTGGLADALATLSDRRDFDPGWIFERKLDGMRLLGVGEEDAVSVRSRTALRLDATYPEIVDALALRTART